MKISQIGELALLEKIRRTFSKKTEKVLVGIGDDAAALKPVNETILATTDMMVEKIHFDFRFITPYQLGFKLLSVNVSDIYAMGGRPFYVLLNLAVNRSTTTEFIDSFFDGVKDAVDFYDMILVGGDLSASNRDMSLSATVIGYVKKYIQRSGAKVGDKIYVTGNLGDSACGLKLLKKIRRPVPFFKNGSAISDQRTTPPHPRGSRGGLNSELQMIEAAFVRLGLPWKVIKPLIRRHLMPEARNPKNFIQAATSMIDVSDGLLIDLTRLCNESNVGARVYIENVPVSRELKKASSYLGTSPERLALSGGEDYELLFTAHPGKKVKAIYIGDVIKSKKVIVDRSGREKPFSSEGYQHFRRKRDDI